MQRRDDRKPRWFEAGDDVVLGRARGLAQTEQDCPSRLHNHSGGTLRELKVILPGQGARYPETALAFLVHGGLLGGGEREQRNAQLTLRQVRGQSEQLAVARVH